MRTDDRVMPAWSSVPDNIRPRGPLRMESRPRAREDGGMSDSELTGGHGEDLVGARRPLRASVVRSMLLAPAGPLARVEVLDRAGSTNRELVEQLRADQILAVPACQLAVAHATILARTRPRLH